MMTKLSFKLSIKVVDDENDKIFSHRHLHINLWIRIVILDDKVLKRKVFDAIDLALELERRKWSGSPLQLLFQRFHMIRVDVGIAQSMHKVAWLQVRHMCDHISQQGVAGDVKGHPKTHVRGPLVHLTGEMSIRDVKLDETMTRRQGHNWNVHRVPGTHYDPPVHGIRLDPVDDFVQLINSLSRVVLMTCLVLRSKVSPLEAIDWSQVALFPVRESTLVQELTGTVPVPDLDPLLLQDPCVCTTADEPEQFLGHSSPEDAFRGEQREDVVAQVEPHLGTEN